MKHEDDDNIYINSVSTNNDDEQNWIEAIQIRKIKEIRESVFDGLGC